MDVKNTEISIILDIELNDGTFFEDILNIDWVSFVDVLTFYSERSESIVINEYGILTILNNYWRPIDISISSECEAESITGNLKVDAFFFQNEYFFRFFLYLFFLHSKYYLVFFLKGFTVVFLGNNFFFRFFCFIFFSNFFCKK